MTRYLSQVLGASEPMFGQSITELERASGQPSADIRLTSDITAKVREKLTLLGLDPSDTTGPELYNALHERLKNDEASVRQALAIDSTAEPTDVLRRVQKFVAAHDMPKQCFALKQIVVKRLLKKKPPKAAMKVLGYRSVDSLLKHEPVAQIYALALLVESHTWQRSFFSAYSKLQSSDFEMREVQLLCADNKKWLAAAAPLVSQSKHNILAFKELGAVVILPMEGHVEGLALATLLLILQNINEIRSYSSYAKLQQVKPDFGDIIRRTVSDEPMTSAQMAGQAVPWRMIQRYYGRFKDAYKPEVFEPHVQPEDLHWHNNDQVLVTLAPTLSFWSGSESLAVLHEGQPVSMNILDVALSYCNHLPFHDRIVHFVRDTVWHELMMRYLNQENLELAVTRQLSRDMVSEEALA